VRATLRHVLLSSLPALAACGNAPAERTPTWADAAPIFAGACNGCHGPTAPSTGGGYRFDFFDATPGVCGDAALALGANVVLAGSSALVAAQIAADVVPQDGATWPRMPPQPSPVLPSWETGTLERWAAQPVKGPPPAGNRPPDLTVTGYPSTAGDMLAFTAVLEDPDGDSAIGVIEANGLAYLMNRPGSFAVAFDSSAWPAGAQPVSAVLCDGWTSTSFQLGAVTVQH